MSLQNYLRTLEYWGISDVIIPFILVFTIIFAVLQKTKILGEGRKNFNVVIALVMALAVIIPHVTGDYYGLYSNTGFDVVEVINSALPNIALVGVAIIMLLLIIGVFGGNVDIAGTNLAGWAVIFSIVAVVYIFGAAGGAWGKSAPRWVMNSDTQALVVMVLVFGIIIWFITKEDKSDGANKGFGGVMKDLGQVLKGRAPPSK
jgi:phosphoglycerol transferase MdoB-like AlkP superfamily enzyme